MTINPGIKDNCPVKDLYGLVICGGKSSRMGSDKSMLSYHGKPQCYHVYEMLELVCERVFISCNEGQAGKIADRYTVLIDLPVYNDCGPVAGILTAFDQYPNNDLLVIGCDYPFLNKQDILNFLPCCNEENSAAAFYNEKYDLYEPLLGYYHHNAAHELQQMFAAGRYSLQHFLKKVNAERFYPLHEHTAKSVDTNEAFMKAMQLITQVNEDEE